LGKSSRALSRSALLLCNLLIFHSSACLLVTTTHIHRRLTAVIIKYLQTPAEAVTGDARGIDVHLNAHLSSQLVRKVAWQGSRLEIDRKNLADWQCGRGFGDNRSVRVDELAANGNTVCDVHVHKVEPHCLIHRQPDGSKPNRDNRKGYVRHADL